MILRPRHAANSWTSQSFAFRTAVPRRNESPDPWNSLPPPFATELITPGPFWFSALKFDIVTLNSEIMFEFGFTGVAQLQPGSETCAPSAVMSSELPGRPLYEYAPFSGLWLPPLPLPLMPMVWPL